MSFSNPLKAYPYNEQFGFDKNLMEIEEDLADIELELDSELIKEEKRNRHLQQILKKVSKQKIKQRYRPRTNPTQWGL